MSEYLAFNKSGQWELHKATGPDLKEPKSDYKPGSATYATRTKTNHEGRLPKDIGQKGSLHDHGGGQVPKGGRVDIKQVVKPARQMESQHNARNPGIGD
jgi:hypothetical protein